MRLEVGGNGLGFREKKEVNFRSVQAAIEGPLPGCRLRAGLPKPRPPWGPLSTSELCLFFQELTWTRIRGQPWSASSSAFGSGRNSSRTFYSLRQNLSSPCPTCISSHIDVSSESWGEGLGGAGEDVLRDPNLERPPPCLFSWPFVCLWTWQICLTVLSAPGPAPPDPPPS